MNEWLDRRDRSNRCDKLIAEEMRRGNILAATVDKSAGPEAGKAVVEGLKKIAKGYQEKADLHGRATARLIDWREQQPIEE